ncbi:hypothetical protein G5I_03043 [Acromyrmex echinatior]|uniref:Ant venom allergen Sol i 2/4 domain-containing protein n=1 Tax=Acromyrmex echinatior TaxID=103372 RepID=F4WBX2_ACREC|nr:hypothetical protein G5I_03043 [Acromyrmex echinatior]
MESLPPVKTNGTANVCTIDDVGSVRFHRGLTTRLPQHVLHNERNCLGFPQRVIEIQESGNQQRGPSLTSSQSLLDLAALEGSVEKPPWGRDIRHDDRVSFITCEGVLTTGVRIRHLHVRTILAIRGCSYVPSGQDRVKMISSAIVMNIAVKTKILYPAAVKSTNAFREISIGAQPSHEIIDLTKANMNHDGLQPRKAFRSSFTLERYITRFLAAFYYPPLLLVLDEEDGIKWDDTLDYLTTIIRDTSKKDKIKEILQKCKEEGDNFQGSKKEKTLKSMECGTAMVKVIGRKLILL